MPKWTGPHEILSLKGDSNVELKISRTGRKLITHVNRLKPYNAGIQTSDQIPDQPRQPTSRQQQQQPEGNIDVDGTTSPDTDFLSPAQLQTREMLRQQQQQPHQQPVTYAAVAAAPPPPPHR